MFWLICNVDFSSREMAKKSNTQVPVLLGTPAVRQILARLSKSEKEENALVEKVMINIRDILRGCFHK